MYSLVSAARVCRYPLASNGNDARRLSSVSGSSKGVVQAHRYGHGLAHLQGPAIVGNTACWDTSLKGQHNSVEYRGPTTKS